MSDLVILARTNAANERMAQHLSAHRGELVTFLRGAPVALALRS